MIVRILDPVPGFPGVGYNTNKVDRNKGELLKVANFGALQGLQQQRPEDYRRYLRMVSASNKTVKCPQFHVVISAKGKEYDKVELTAIAEKWLAAMGYGKQPYLVIFHKDTENNHVHLVTTRIDRNGKKIPDSFERNRSLQHMNDILGVDPKLKAQQDIESALAYQFGTKAQLMMILESQGYILKETDGKFLVIKFGKQQGEVDIKRVEDKLKSYSPDQTRKAQLKAFFHKYAASCSPALIKDRKGYTSDFAMLLKEKFGIHLVFHASAGKEPYGYTVIDPAGKAVFKGGEIVPLKELLSIRTVTSDSEEQQMTAPNVGNTSGNITADQLDYYSAILKAAIHNYPDLVQGLQHQGLMIYRNGESFNLHDPGAGIAISLEDLLGEKDYNIVVETFSQSQEISDEVYRQHHHFPGVNLASDIDDEAIHGRNRRRKQKARTNSR
jgi:hypothetical protein